MCKDSTTDDTDDDDSEDGHDEEAISAISFDVANIHRTALLCLLETTKLSKLPINGATLQVEDVQHQFIKLPTALPLHSQGIKKQTSLLTCLIANKQGLEETNRRESVEDSDPEKAG
jgi:hypothetical protein